MTFFRTSLRDMTPPDPNFLSGSGGFFVDVTVHDLDVARWLVGEVVEVTAHGAASDPAFAALGDIDTAVCVLRFANGALGVIDNSRSARYGYECSTEVMGTQATVRVEAPRPLEWRTPGQATYPLARDFEERYPAAYAAELDAFARCVLDGTPPRVTGRDALAAFDLAIAATESWRTGTTGVSVPPRTARAGAKSRPRWPGRREASMNRIAGAPISWGVCEVPGWGYQLPPARVLAEMQEVGLAATELGPDGFLPAAPDAMAARARRAPPAGHRRVHPDPVARAGPRPRARRAASCSRRTPRRVRPCWCSPPTPGRPATTPGPSWTRRAGRTLLGNLDRIAAVAGEHGVKAVLHPHVGTMVENPDDVRRVLDGSSIALCLDTGHLLIGGTDPAELARQVPDRIAHTHIKDVDAAKAKQVQSGRLSYTEAVRDGMYRPVGQGDVDFAAIVTSLRGRAYDGWYVLEQDTILTEEPRGEGPVADVHTSVEHLRTLLSAER